MIGSFLKKIFSCSCCCDSETTKESTSNSATATIEKPQTQTQTPETPKEAPVAKAPVKNTVDLVITKSLINDVLVLKAVREIAHVDNNKAIQMLGSYPATIKKDLNKDDAQKLKQQLEELGAIVELQ